MKKLIGTLLTILFCIVSASSQAQVSKILGMNADTTLPPPPPPCSTFNISGPVSSVDVGDIFAMSQISLRVVSSLGTFGFVFKTPTTPPKTLHLKVGTLSPLSLIVDNSVVTWSSGGEEDSYAFGASANGYVLQFRPLASSQPLNRRTVAYSAENGSLLGTQNFTVGTNFTIDDSFNTGQTFDGGRYYSQGGPFSGGLLLMVAWNHGVLNLTNMPSSINAIFGFGYDGVSKIFAYMNQSGSNPQRVVTKWAKFNGTSTDFETQNDISNIVGQIGGLVFGNNKVYVSESPNLAAVIRVVKLSTNLAVEQIVNLFIPDGNAHNGSNIGYDSIYNKLYVISNVLGGSPPALVGRRIFRLNPTDLSVEQVFTVSGTNNPFKFGTSSFWVSDNGRRAWTFEQDTSIQHYFVREWSLCS
jgi:hypothetical protein